MKAPEKIYLTEDNPSKEWYRTKQVGFDSTEYTRTDAFIEKACDWLNETLRNTDFYENEIELMVNEFKKAMKL
jgi:hypothetical protein